MCVIWQVISAMLSMELKGDHKLRSQVYEPVVHIDVKKYRTDKKPKEHAVIIFT